MTDLLTLLQGLGGLGGPMQPPIYPGQFPGNDAFGAPAPPTPTPMLPPQDPGGLAGTGTSGMVRPGSPFAQLAGLLGPAQAGPAFPRADAFGVGLGTAAPPQPTPRGFDETGMPRYDDTGIGAPMGPSGPTSGSVPLPTPRPPSLGQSLEPGAPNGSPMDIRSIDQKRMNRMSQPGATDPAAAGMAQRIQQALKGVQAPPKPDVVKPTTPAGPAAPRSIQSGGLLELINSLSNPRAPMQRPATLGGALGIGRY